jgi:phospholipid-binding lipoprotein MlaA
MAMRFCIILLSLSASFGSYSQTMQGDKDIYMSDPIEPINRWIWDFNYYVLDAYIYKPVTQTYVDWVPDLGREVLNNAMLNLEEPSNFVNNILQLEFKGATDSLFRFAFNSSFGLLGLFDVAKLGGVERKSQSFGNVLGHWDVPHGPYLMLPAIGPRSTRNLVGNVVDSLYFPSTSLELWQSGVVWGLNGVHAREGLLGKEILIDQSLDSYTFIKEAYIQSELFKSNEHQESVDPFTELKQQEDLQQAEPDLSNFMDEID